MATAPIGESYGASRSGAAYVGLAGPSLAERFAALSLSDSADTLAGAAVMGARATAVTISGPSGGLVGVASTPITLGLNGSTHVSVIITPAATGGTFSPTTVTITPGGAAQTCTFTPSSEGAKSITLTNNGGLTNPAAWAYTATAEATAPPPSAAYRNAQAYLFQPSPPSFVDPVLGGTFDYDSNSNAGFGPSYTRVDAKTHWAWDNPGGDWIDSAGTRQGTSHMATMTANAVSGSGVSHRYTGQPVTTLVQRAQTGNRWLAVRVGLTGGARAIAGPTHAQPPVINVTYSDGATGALACRILARSSSGSSTVSTRPATQSLPAFIEFERPSKTVASATLDITVTEHWSGSSTLSFNLCDPTLNTAPITTGMSTGYPLDVSITTHGSILGAHRYVDGSVLSSFVHTSSVNWSGEPQYSAEFWGGAVEVGKLPYAGAGKFIPAADPSANLSLVSSSYTGEGFVALIPGMGALRAFMPDQGTGSGQTWGEYGTVAANYKLFVPPAEFGTLGRMFVRYYVRLGTPFTRTGADRFQVNKGGTPTWVDMGGKWGINPAHLGHLGVSGGSGGPYGWQMRNGWAESEAQLGGPVEGGINVGWHLYDFGNANPPGHRYQANTYPEGWGQLGGLGSTLYAGRWYCVEVEVKANSVDALSSAGDGLNWTADGELRTWIDGRLVYQRTGMVFRTMPKYAPASNPLTVRPVGDLGITELWWNWYHGGLSPSSAERTHFVTGLVWGKERIGPMHIPVQISGSNWTPNVDGANNVLASDYAQLPADVWLTVSTNKIDDLVPPGLHPSGSRYGTTVSGADGLPSVVKAWSGAAWDWVNGRMYIAGGGHADSWGTENGVFKFDVRTMRFSVAVSRSAYSAAQWYDRNLPGYVSGTNAAGNGGPQTDGAPPAMHTYQAIKWLPPGTIGSNTSGYFVQYAPGRTLNIANLDTGGYFPAWFKQPAPSPAVPKDFSYATAWTQWPYMWSPGITSTQQFGGETFRLNQTEATLWSAVSQGLQLGNYTSSGIPYTHRANCQMHPRREMVVMGWDGSAVMCRRFRLGQAADAAAPLNLGTYADTITLIGDTADLTRNNFLEYSTGGGTPTGAFYEAGLAYDEAADALWMCGNKVGNYIYKFTGLNTNTWTVTRYTSDPVTVTSAPSISEGGTNGTYGRFQVFTISGVTLAMRVTATTDFAQVRRLA